MAIHLIKKKAPKIILCNQIGFSMIVALVALLALVLVGTSAIKNSIMQERMTGNTKDMSLAFQAAETALRDAEKDISKNIFPFTEFKKNCEKGLCLPSASNPVWNSVDWLNPSYTRFYGQYTNTKTSPILPLPEVSQQPIYIIEILPPIDPIEGESIVLGMPSKITGKVYRITVFATGARITTRIMLQSIYRKQ